MNAATRIERKAARDAEDARVIAYAKARRAALTNKQRCEEDRELARLRSIFTGS